MKQWALLLLTALVLLFPIMSGCAGKEEYSLTIAVSGEGTTDPSPGIYPCDEGRWVTIAATPDSGWQFDDWSGDTTETAATVAICVDLDKSVTAHFSEISYKVLTVAVSGSGIISPTVGDHDCVEGTEVTIAAAPAEGWQFDNWTGDVADPDSASTTVTMDSDKTVTANFSEVITGPVVPSAGTTWVYDVHYSQEAGAGGVPSNPAVEEDSVWTMEVTGEEMVDSEDCYITETAFDPYPERYSAGTMIWIVGGTTWNSKVTFDSVKTEAVAWLAGVETLEMATYIARTYTGDHGWEFTVGKAWSYVEVVELDPPLAPGYENTYEAEVVAQEDVTVAAGTYSCYKIEYTLVAEDGVEIPEGERTVEYTDWWSADVSGLVKKANYSFDGVETQELKSYTLV